MPTSHVTLLLSYSMILLFFLTFDGSIVTLGSINITFYRTFAPFSYTRIFFSHLIVPSSNCAVPTSIVTLDSTNILFDNTFLTLSGTLIFTHICARNWENLAVEFENNKPPRTRDK